MMQTLMNAQTIPRLIWLHTDITGEDDSLDVSLDVVPDVLPHGASLPAHQADQVPVSGADQRVNLGIEGGA